jgi:sarcosine oxidase subunit beta
LTWIFHRALKGQIAIKSKCPIGETNAWSAAYIASKLDASIMPDRSEYDKQIGLGFAFSQSISGNYLIGSTREHAGYDKTTALQAITTTVRQACRFFPIMNSVNIIRTVAGIRPASADGSPIVWRDRWQARYFHCSRTRRGGIALSR